MEKVLGGCFKADSAPFRKGGIIFAAGRESWTECRIGGLVDERGGRYSVLNLRVHRVTILSKKGEKCDRSVIQCAGGEEGNLQSTL